jgi:uncharacterized protein YdeI (BOF family)
METTMKVLAALALLVGMCVTPVYAQQKGTVTFNGNVFDAPPPQGWYQQPGAYAQPPAKAKTYRHARRHATYKKSAS